MDVVKFYRENCPESLQQADGEFSGIYDFEKDVTKLMEDWRRETLKSKGIKCLRDVILVEPGEADEMVNGLIMPENTRDKPMRGTVLAVGPGKDEKPMTVKVGDVVFYSRHAGVDVIHEEKECLLMRETDVFAVL